ncbi:hypothetical protein V6N12_033681 [Hibiscus sabdariffa]|uniref:Cytochrome P450 n=1 Tax=Hibiscus sabdariffa TaxID=183260 RepID=A0ABR2A0X1_9ROSI
MLYLLLTLLFSCWILPIRAYRKLKKNGLVGPTPSFPMGNNREMTNNSKSYVSSAISHDIHYTVFPHFAHWQKSYRKEPFLYVADLEFLRKMSSRVLGKNWGIVKLFKRDREPMFESGLVMVEGDDWVRHRHLVTPAFSPSNLKMEWVLKEVLRLYSPAPNTQRQTREDIKVDDVVIPNGTSIWIDIVAMHNDPMIWGDDVYDFRPDRFKDDSLYGGCKHKMGYLPFGFGGKMRRGRSSSGDGFIRRSGVVGELTH